MPELPELVIHLKLTGQLIFNGKPSPYTRQVFYFDDGSCLVFNDVRKFGWWKELKETKTLEKDFGPEALTVDFKIEQSKWREYDKEKIKTLLLGLEFLA